MASIEVRETASGTSWRVRYRHAGQRGARTFVDEGAAMRWKALVEVNPEQALAALTGPTDAALPATVLDAVAAHIDQLTGIEAGTRANYRGIVDRHIKPHPLARRLIGTATRADIASWVTWLHEERRLSGKTIANIHGLMSAAMTTAVRDGLRVDNPCRGMRLPRTTDTERDHIYLTKDEFSRLWRIFKPAWSVLPYSLAGTGMRFGEATALQVRDIDLNAREARIQRAWKPTGVGGQRRLGPTKTRRSDRTIALPENTCRLIEPLLFRRDPEDFVITNRRGLPVRQPTFWRSAWRPAVAEFAGDDYTVTRSGITIHKEGRGKHPRVHDLRHSWASWHISAGTPLPVIQRQLGHESIQTTIDVYGHLARSDFDALGSATNTWLPTLDVAPQIED